MSIYDVGNVFIYISDIYLLLTRGNIIMKTFLKYFSEREGLGELGNQDLADDHEKYGNNEDSPSNDESFPTTQDKLTIVKKAVRIAMQAGEKYRNKIYEFLNRLSRDIPELQNLVSQLRTDKQDDDDDDDPSKQQGAPQKPVVSAPNADSPPQPSADDNN
jgi:hypothetical protein